MLINRKEKWFKKRQKFEHKIDVSVKYELESCRVRTYLGIFQEGLTVLEERLLQKIDYFSL
jgi:hypothetical protein